MKKLSSGITNVKIAGISIAPMLVAGMIAFTSTAILGSMLLQPSDRELEAKEIVNQQYSSFLNKKTK